jgi:5-methylcytosine-specific restriction endonuclease McrA
MSLLPRCAIARGVPIAMSDHRRPRIPHTDAPRGICRWCGKAIFHDEETPKAGEVNLRRRWHPDCVDEYNASDPREARRLVRRRDRGICRECQLDTNRLKRETKGRGRARKLRELGFKARRSLWELDHILPLIDGGGHGLDNLQTLCVPCHEEKTAREAMARAERRRSEKSDSPTATRAHDQNFGIRRPRDGASSLDEVLTRAEQTNRRVERALEEIR